MRERHTHDIHTSSSESHEKEGCGQNLNELVVWLDDGEHSYCTLTHTHTQHTLHAQYTSNVTQKHEASLSLSFSHTHTYTHALSLSLYLSVSRSLSHTFAHTNIHTDTDTDTDRHRHRLRHTAHVSS